MDCLLVSLGFPGGCGGTPFMLSFRFGVGGFASLFPGSSFLVSGDDSVILLHMSCISHFWLFVHIAILKDKPLLEFHITIHDVYQYVGWECRDREPTSQVWNASILRVSVASLLTAWIL